MPDSDGAAYCRFWFIEALRGRRPGPIRPWYGALSPSLLLPCAYELVEGKAIGEVTGALGTLSGETTEARPFAITKGPSRSSEVGGLL